MFDREGFIDYVGEKSGNSYASGLGRIERLYSVDIDAEYSKDKCDALLAQIESDKQRTDLDQKELKKRSDASSHLKRYITFRMNAVDTVADRILFVIDHYKANFGAVNKDEHYKWEALGWYKKHWNIDAEDFADMLTNAFSKTSNLLSSGMYYPYKMITEYAQADPEEVRRIFKLLHDESIPLAERYHLFRDSCKARIDQIMNEQPGREKALNHYQDLRAVMVYLTFEYPEKYYLFKSTMYSDFRDRIGFREEKTNQTSVIGKVDNFFRMCDMILEEVKMDHELISMHKSRLGEDCYSDDALHLLTMDIVYYGSNYMSEDDFKKRPITKTETTYWPSLEEYNPGITKDMWISVLSDPAITTPENLDMLKKMLELGGESTCAHLAEVYGKTHSYYNKLGSSYGEKVKRRFNCPDCPDRESDTVERNRVYVIPFVGRYVTENGNKRYSWKLRDELKEALMSIDIPNPEPGEETTTDIGLNTILYGPPGTGKTMAAQVIANELQMELCRVDLSQVSSKYIGETEKNLEKIFREAEQSNVILFFDEADSLFGKRTEVKDSNDKYANQETSYILQRIESYNGMVILATNFARNFDPAFMRRITVSIQFDLPDENIRKQLWRDMLRNTELSTNETLMQELAEQFELTGSYIKSAVRNAVFMALIEERSLCTSDLIAAIKIEFEKMGKIVNASNFGTFFSYIT